MPKMNLSLLQIMILLDHVFKTGAFRTVVQERYMNFELKFRFINFSASDKPNLKCCEMLVFVRPADKK